MNWYFIALKKGVTFRGRARRKEYWYFFLFNIVFSISLSLLDGMLGLYDTSESIGVLSGIYSILMILPGLSVTVRRLHDTDRSGWWALLRLIPVLGFLFLLYVLVKDGSYVANRFGENPKEWQQASTMF